MSFADAFPGFKLRLTRWGAAYIAGCVVLGLAAVNTGNNALMSILAMALGSYVVSGTWSRQVLASIDVEVVLPSEAFAGREAFAEVVLHNRSRVFPAYGVVLRSADGAVLAAETLLGRGRRRSTTVTLRFARRGWRRIGPWRLEVLLPLGFFLKSKELIPEKKILVFPRLLDREPTVELDRDGGDRSGELLGDRGREGEVSQLRDFRDGDDRRQLHWKQTARQQRPIVVDRQHQVEGPVFLVLDPRIENPDDDAARARFETVVSEVATMAVRRLAQSTPVGLVVGDTVVPPVRDRTRAALLLRPLAEVEPTGIDGAAPVHVRSRRVAVFDAGPRP